MRALQKEVSNDPFLEFLKQAGRAQDKIYPLGADMGARQYFYVGDVENGALLMDMSRTGKEAGLEHYLKIASFLNQADVNTPEIYHYDLSKGLALIEYLGDDSFGDAMRGGQDQKGMYLEASRILKTIREKIPNNEINLPAYADTGIRQRVSQFVEWYVPSSSNAEPSEELYGEMESMWAAIEAGMPPAPEGLCHADYHLENIMWRPWGEGHKYGLIDFQDAFWGPLSYDLVNLLKDARKTVPQDIQDAILADTYQNMNAEEREGFQAWFDLMAAHFHCRVIGLFIKFSQETNTDKFLAHIPRLQHYMNENLEKPILKPLKEFCNTHSITFDQPPVVKGKIT